MLGAGSWGGQGIRQTTVFRGLWKGDKTMEGVGLKVSHAGEKMKRHRVAEGDGRAEAANRKGEGES